MCAWKNPSGKRLAPGTAPSQAPPIVPPQGPPPKKGAAAAMMSRKSADPATPKQERGRKSISVISPAVVKVSRFSYHFSTMLHGISFIPPNFLLKKIPSLYSLFLFRLDAGKARLFCLLLLSCSCQCFTNVGTGETDCKLVLKFDQHVWSSTG